MPNLVPPVTKVAEASAYRDRIRRAVPAELKFEPLMTCYLTDGADPVELANGKQQGVWVAAKLYPAHATTNSAHGVTSMDKVARGLEAMEKAGMPLLVHGEVTDAEVDIFDREAVFLDKVLAPLLKRHPGLKIVLEHITTKQGVEFVEAHPGRLGGTITPHHLNFNRNAIFKGGIRPHFYCLPIAKAEELAALAKQRQSQAAEIAVGIGGAETGAGPTHWYDHLQSKGSRPWFIVDPADGRVPPFTPQAARREAAFDQLNNARDGEGRADSWLDRSMYDRCITRGLPGSTAWRR